MKLYFKNKFGNIFFRDDNRDWARVSQTKLFSRSVSYAGLEHITCVEGLLWKAFYNSVGRSSLFHMDENLHAEITAIFKQPSNEFELVPFEKILPKKERLVLDENQSFTNIGEERKNELLIRYEMALESAEEELKVLRPNLKNKKVKFLSSDSNEEDSEFENKSTNRSRKIARNFEGFGSVYDNGLTELASRSTEHFKSAANENISKITNSFI